MAILRMKVTTATMPPSPEFFAVVKAVERFYYALLFSTDAAYSGRPEPWWSWVEQGFSAAIRQAPPETRERDALATSVRSDGKVIEVTAVSSMTNCSRKSGAFSPRLAPISWRTRATVRPRLPLDMAGSSVLRERLMAPVSAALASSGVDRRTSDRIMEMLFAAVRALKYRDIVSIAQSVSAGGESHISKATS